MFLALEGDFDLLAGKLALNQLHRGARFVGIVELAWELVAADTIHPAALLVFFQGVGCDLEDHVAIVVAVGVVLALEVVQVGADLHREAFGFIVGAAVRQAGQVVREKGRSTLLRGHVGHLLALRRVRALRVHEGFVAVQTGVKFLLGQLRDAADPRFPTRFVVAKVRRLGFLERVVPLHDLGLVKLPVALVLIDHESRPAVIDRRALLDVHIDVFLVRGARLGADEIAVVVLHFGFPQRRVVFQVLPGAAGRVFDGHTLVGHLDVAQLGIAGKNLILAGRLVVGRTDCGLACACVHSVDFLDGGGNVAGRSR